MAAVILMIAGFIPVFSACLLYTSNNPLVEVIDVDAHINDEAFAIFAARKLVALMEMKK